LKEPIMDRVAIVAWCWFVGFIGFGYAAGALLFSTPWTGGVVGLIAALLSSLAWPWILPDSITDWMDDRPAWPSGRI
jgi:hypothetical protein